MAKNSVARFSTWDKDTFLFVSDALQYVFIGRVGSEEVRRINVHVFPTSLELNLASEGQWAVGTKQGVLLFKSEGAEIESFSGHQNVRAVAFSGNGKKMAVSGSDEIAVFEV